MQKLHQTTSVSAKSFSTKQNVNVQTRIKIMHDFLHSFGRDRWFD